MSEIKPIARIMVVDDSLTIRTQLKALLESKGYEVLTCEDGFEALASVVEFNPNLIFTDISMPKVDGYETVTLLRTSPYFASTPVIMLSSKSGVFDIARGKLLGCDDYITKPVSAASVSSALDRHLHHDSSAAILTSSL